MNTPPAAKRALAEAGFEAAEVRMIESWPGYLVFNPLAFWVGVGYERVVNRSPRMSRFRLIMIGRAKKSLSGSAIGAPRYAPPQTTEAGPGS